MDLPDRRVNLSVAAWEQITASGIPRRFPAGTVLLRQGDPATTVLALTHGRVKVTLDLPDGEGIVLAVRGAGDLLGYYSVLGGGTRTATVKAIVDCETSAMHADRFVALVRELGLEGELLRHAMSRIREGESWRAELAALPAGPRVVRAVLRFCEVTGPGTGVVELDQTELSMAAGLARSTVAHELARLRARGLVTTARRRIVVTDLGLLRTLAETGQPNV